MDYNACPSCGVVLFRAGPCPKCGGRSGGGGGPSRLPRLALLGGGGLSVGAILIGAVLGVASSSRRPRLEGTPHPAGPYRSPAGNFTVEVTGSGWIDVDPKHLPAAWRASAGYDLSIANPENTAFMLVGSEPLPDDLRGDATLNLDAAMEAIMRGYEERYTNVSSSQAPIALRGTRARARDLEFTSKKGERVHAYVVAAVAGGRFYLVATGCKPELWEKRRFDFEHFLESFDGR